MLFSRKIFFVLSLALCVFSVPAVAEVISTGSESADSVLQWLTTIVTMASLVANFTPSPVDNAGVRVLSLLINLAAANWRQISKAWGGRDVLAWALPAVLVLGVAGGAGEASAAVCPAAQGITCPAYTVCIQAVMPVDRADGSPFSVSELRRYELSIADRPFVIAPGAKVRFDYALAPDEVLVSGTVLTLVAVDMAERKGAAAACTLAKAVSGPPKPAPGVPALSVTLQ